MDFDADRVIESLEAAREENLVDPYRKAQVVTLPADHEVWMTGDIHDHRTNFGKLISSADLSHHPNRHIVLHEIIHGDHIGPDGAEDSWRMLLQAAELKINYPEQVHFLLANHDLAQIYGEGIMKAGLSVCEAFNAGIKRDFPGGRDSMVTVGITEFLLSLPLAIRCPNGLWFSHSIPTDEQLKTYDYTVFERDPLEPADFKRRTGAVYQLVWGRKYTADAVKEFAEKMGAKLLVTGHQPQEMGLGHVGEQMLIVDSSHNQGVFIPLSTSQDYSFDDVRGNVRKIMSLTVSAED